MIDCSLEGRRPLRKPEKAQLARWRGRFTAGRDHKMSPSTTCMTYLRARGSDRISMCSAFGSTVWSTGCVCWTSRPAGTVFEAASARPPAGMLSGNVSGNSPGPKRSVPGVGRLDPCTQWTRTPGAPRRGSGPGCPAASASRRGSRCPRRTAGSRAPCSCGAR
ncbi:hypothetical protein EGW08_002515 [Elysia chlorotica]|uniref:Uncharacterized protein n=1 Tax=Elysia chlorotica TaxID=188477 RepID=A0A3S1CDG0_ELYCH|nr:hypothetical protein EGW08_002515 [Elysia chlorotica]